MVQECGTALSCLSIQKEAQTQKKKSEGENSNRAQKSKGKTEKKMQGNLTCQGEKKKEESRKGRTQATKNGGEEETPWAKTYNKWGVKRAGKKKQGERKAFT